MMSLNRGLVMEVNSRSCIVLTGDGRFIEVPKPRGGVEVGREIMFNRPVIFRFKTAYLAVASMMICVLAWGVFNTMLPRAVAYVALDINPSLELGIDDDSLIISARGVNEEGQKLLQRVAVLHEPLAKGVQKIITGSVEYHYLNPDQDNIVLATVTDAKRNNTGIDKENEEIKQVYNCVYNSINNTINKSGVGAELIVVDSDLDTMEKARDSGVTPGRYLLQKEAQKNGVQITNQELREERIRELEVKKSFRAGELIQKRFQTRFSGNSGKLVQTGQTGRPDKTVKLAKDVSSSKTDQAGNVSRPNKRVSLPPGKDNAKNDQSGINSNNIKQTEAREKQDVTLGNEDLMEKTEPKQQIMAIQNENNVLQNSKHIYQTDAQAKQYVSRKSGYLLKKAGSSLHGKQLLNQDSHKQNANKIDWRVIREEQPAPWKHNYYSENKWTSEIQELLQQTMRSNKTRSNENNIKSK